MVGKKFLFRIRNKKTGAAKCFAVPVYRPPTDEFCRKTGKKKEDYISEMI